MLLMNWTHWFDGMMETTPSDRMYNCLPMCHRVDGAVTTSAVLVNGGSVVIRDRFSTAAFWDDIRRYDRAMFPYIGELCRISSMPPRRCGGDAVLSLGMGTPFTSSRESRTIQDCTSCEFLPYWEMRPSWTL
jgi:hypothetical protein